MFSKITFKKGKAPRNMPCSSINPMLFDGCVIRFLYVNNKKYKNYYVIQGPYYIQQGNTPIVCFAYCNNYYLNKEIDIARFTYREVIFWDDINDAKKALVRAFNEEQAFNEARED